MNRWDYAIMGSLILVAIGFLVGPALGYPVIIIINSTEDIPMFWNGTGWEELTTPYNTNATHNESMTAVPEGYVK